MAALTTSLMGSGMSSQLATQLGEVIVSATGVGTVQGGSSPIARGGQVVLFTTAASNTAITLDAAIAVGDVVEISTITATTALVYPPTGGTIDQGAANASTSVAQNKTRRIRRVSPTAFTSMLGA